MGQNVTTEDGIQPYKSGVFEEYVTYCALGGMMTDDVGGISTMTQEKFCETRGVSRMTLSRWKNETHDFAELVRARRDEIVPLARETAALNRLYVIGMSSLGEQAAHHDQRAAVDALKTYTGHHSKLRLPKQSVEVEAGESLVDLFREVSDVIEGELVEPNAGPEKENLRALPQPN